MRGGVGGPGGGNTMTPDSFYHTEYTRNTPVVKPRAAPIGRGYL